MKNYFRCFLVFAAFLASAAGARAADALVSTDWVRANAGKPGIVMIDIRSAAAYQAGHVTGAESAPFALPHWRAAAGGLPTALPRAAAFADFASWLGIGKADHVVILGAGSGFAETAQATQIYWTFKVMGHRDVSLLNGGMRAYFERLFPTEKTPRVPRAATYAVAPNPALLATTEDVRNGIGKALLVDARPAGQFLGIAKIAAVRRRGTLPTAVNFPCNWLIDDSGGPFRSVETIKKIWG